MPDSDVHSSDPDVHSYAAFSERGISMKDFLDQRIPFVEMSLPSSLVEAILKGFLTPTTYAFVLTKPNFLRNSIDSSTSWGVGFQPNLEAE